MSSARKRKRVPIEDRFWSRVSIEQNTGCWIWMGPFDRSGYGLIGRGGNREGVERVHRVAFRLVRGEPTPGLEMDHLCRHRWCCNPAHLEEVTHRENCLRGTSPAAVHAKKTHCPRGHAYDEKNTYIAANGARICRPCGAMHRREYVKAKKAAGLWP